MATPFNINDYVRIKITPHGEKIHREHYGAYERYGVKAPEIERDADGWTTEQLWVVMNIYGPHMANGGDAPIETTIEFM